MGGKRLRAVLVAALVPALGACNDAEVRGFHIETIDFHAARRRIEEAPTRVELELYSTWAQRIAREMKLEPEHRAPDDERIESRVINPGFEGLVVEGGCRGTLTLDLLGVEVAFDEHTRFEDQDGSRITCVELVTLIESYLALGQEPQITAERRPPASPQDPNDNVFLADEIELDDEDEDGDQRPEISLQLDADNMASCSDLFAPPTDCVGAVRALGVLFAIGGGATEVEVADPEPRLSARFDGIVKSVDVEAREIRLTTGTVLRLVRGSEIEWGEAEGASLLTSLEDADASLDLGRLVEAHGTAEILATDPLVLWVREVELEVERDLSEDDFRNIVEIEGEVLGVDVEAGFAMLPFDTRLRITEVSSLEGDFRAIDEIGSAMYAGRRIRADARVVVEEIQNPVLVTRADRATFVAD